MSASELILTDKKPTEYQPNESSTISDLLSMITQLTEQNKNFLDTINSQAGTIAELTRELEWFRRNMFGKKSEKSRGFDYDDPDFYQQSLFDSMTEEQKQLLGIAGEDTEEKPPEKITINSYKRTKTERKKSVRGKSCWPMPGKVRTGGSTLLIRKGSVTGAILR